MSDMVQQPVIQLVQELTMTAVVERHDCTDTKKEEKSRSPRPHLNTHNAFNIPPFLENITNQTDLHRWVWHPIKPPSMLSVVIPTLETQVTSRKWGSLASKRCWWVPSKFLGGDSPSPPRRKAGEKECLPCFQTGPTQLVTLSFIKLSSDTSEICWH